MHPNPLVLVLPTGIDGDLLFVCGSLKFWVFANLVDLSVYLFKHCILYLRGSSNPLVLVLPTGIDGDLLFVCCSLKFWVFANFVDLSVYLFKHCIFYLRGQFIN